MMIGGIDCSFPLKLWNGSEMNANTGRIARALACIQSLGDNNNGRNGGSDLVREEAWEAHVEKVNIYTRGREAG